MAQALVAADSVHHSIIEKSFTCLRFLYFEARFPLMVDVSYANR